MAGLQLFTDQIKENRLLFLGWGNLLFGILIFIISLIKVGANYFPSSEGLSKIAPKREFCLLGMNQMIQKNLSNSFIKEGLYELVTKNHYQALLLDGSEKVLEVWTNEKLCKVLLQTKEGLRSFDFFLDESTENKFFYLIQRIRENELLDKARD